jgi:hypothetical protein
MTRPVLTCAAAVALVCGAADRTNAQLLPAYTDLRLKKMTYTNSGGERGATYFYYGRNGEIQNAVWTLADSSRYSCNFHVYDESGCEVQKYREFSDGLTSTETYGCDAAGRRISELFRRADGVTGTATYVRDPDGRLIEAVCDNFRGWFTGRIVYAYDKGRPAGATIFRGGGQAGKIAYAYDGAGHRVGETWDFGEHWSQTFTYAYEPRPAKLFGCSSPYVAMNAAYRVAAEEYDFNGEGGGPSHYTYDSGGRLVTKVFERSDGLKTTTTYRYDDVGNLVSSHRRYRDGQTANFQYEFDHARRLTRKTFRRSDGQEGHEIYEYDGVGRIATAEYDNMDFWLNGTIRFRYDAWGALARGRFEGRDGFDADIEFDTDGEGNVTKMHWIFSFGKTQTYLFRYEPVGG